MQTMSKIQEYVENVEEEEEINPDKWFNIPAVVVKAVKYLVSHKKTNDVKLKNVET